LQITGEAALRHVLEASTNLTQWVPLLTNSVPGGAFDVLDGAPALLPRRFYRVRVVEP
jgi:hypothetical protein